MMPLFEKYALELLGPESLLARWRYTIGRAPLSLWGRGGEVVSRVSLEGLFDPSSVAVVGRLAFSFLRCSRSSWL